MGFQIYSSEPCLLNKENIIIGIYIDDILVIGSKDDIKTFVNKLQNIFKLRIKTGITEFIGCEFEWNSNKDQIILHQIRIINKLDTSFNSEIKDL